MIAYLCTLLDNIFNDVTPQRGMTRNRIIDDFYEKQGRILLEAVDGKPLTAIRRIIEALQRCTKQTRTVLQPNRSADVTLTITPDDAAQRQLRESAMHLQRHHPEVLTQLARCAANVREIVMHALASNGNGTAIVTGTLPANDPLIVGAPETGITLEPNGDLPSSPEPIRATDPLSCLAPLRAPPSDALLRAMTVASETFAPSGRGRAGIMNLFATFDAQSLLRSENRNECIDALETLAREFPELTPEIHALYRSLIDTATELFQSLRTSALLPTSHEEFVRYLVLLHQEMFNAIVDCDVLSGAAGLKHRFANLLTSSVMQSLTMARMFSTANVKNYFTMQPEHTDVNGLRKRQKGKIEKNSADTNKRWTLLFEQWKNSLTIAKNAGRDTPQDRAFLSMLHNVCDGVNWLYMLYRSTDMTVVHPQTDEQQKEMEFKHRHAADNIAPAFSSVISYAPMFREAVNAHDSIIRRVSHMPGSLPTFGIDHKNGSSNTILHCWMCLPDGDVSSPRNVIPFVNTCGDQPSPCGQRLMAFADSLTRSGIIERDNIVHDPFLSPHVRTMLDAGIPLIAYHDADILAVVAPESLASGPLSTIALFGQNARSIADHVMRVHAMLPGNATISGTSVLISVETSSEGHTAQKTPCNGKEQRIKDFIRKRHTWPMRELPALLQAARITINEEKGTHWYFESDQGKFSIPSAGLKAHELNSTVVQKIILQLGDIDAFTAWLRTQ